MQKVGKKQIALYVLQCIFLLILIPGCFAKDKEIQFYTGNSIETFEAGGGRVYHGSTVTLSPGIYEVRLQVDLAEGQILKSEVFTDSDHHKSLLCNSVSLYSGSEPKVYSIWVTDYIEAWLSCNTNASEQSALQQIGIYRTNRGCRFIFLNLLFLFLVLDALLLFRRRIREGKITPKKQIVFWSLLGGIGVAFLPYFTDYMIIGADTLFHVTRIAGLADSMRTGAGFPVRIQSWWNAGHGYAVSLFYGDLFLYFPAFLLFMGYPIMTAYKAFLLLLNASTAIITYRCFNECVKEEYAALFGSLFYLLLPYKIFNLYNRGAIGECCAMTFLPMVFCGIYLLFTEDCRQKAYKRYKWYLIIGLSAIINSHVISTELVVVCIVIFCLIFWKKTFCKETFWQLFSGAGITLLINMWFWLPLLYMLKADDYHMSHNMTGNMQDCVTVLAGIFQLLPNKGAAQTGMFHNEPIQLGIGILMLMVIGVLWLKKDKALYYAQQCKVFWWTTLVMQLLSLRYLPWDTLKRIPLIGAMISSIQFPWRLLILGSLFGAAYAAFFFARVMRLGGRNIKAAVVTIGAISLLATVYHVNNISYESMPCYIYDAENFGTIQVVNGEYLLDEVGEYALDLYYHMPIAEDGLEWWDYKKQGIQMELMLSNQTEKNLSIDMPVMGYKGYDIKVKDMLSLSEEIPYVSEEVGMHGDLKLIVPKGFSGKISVSYEGFWFFHVAELVSMLTIISIVGVKLYQMGKKKWYECKV